jgi:hypothetical protein
MGRKPADGYFHCAAIIAVRILIATYGAPAKSVPIRTQRPLLETFAELKNISLGSLRRVLAETDDV